MRRLTDNTTIIVRCLMLCLMASLVASCHKSSTVKQHRRFNREARSPRDDGGTATGRHTTSDEWATLSVKLSRSDNKALYDELRSWLGTPYSYAHSDKGKGTDCSGMVMMVVKTVYGKDIERNSARIFEKNCSAIDREKLREGDLVFFNGKRPGSITHVGIYLREGYFVHTSSSRGVMVSNLADRYWSAHYECSGRLR